jgi:hypothetical protein
MLTIIVVDVVPTEDVTTSAAKEGWVILCKMTRTRCGFPHGSPPKLKSVSQ